MKFQTHKLPAVADFRFADLGSICTLKPQTDAATAWADEHLPEDRQTWAGAVIVEPRYVSPIIEGIVADGLTVQR